MTSNLMVWLIAAPALATVVIPALGAIYSSWRSPLFILAHVVSLALALLALVKGPGRVLVEIRRGSADVQLGLVQDEATGLALVLAALVLLALGLFSQGYVRGIRLGVTFRSLLLLEQAAVNLVLLAGDLLALYAGLLILSVALMLIVGIDFNPAGEAAALRIFATVEVPAALAFVGFWLIDARAGTLALSDLSQGANWLSHPSSWALLLPIVIALVSRAGLAPLQKWVAAGCRAAVAPGAIALAGVALPVGVTVLARVAGPAIPLAPVWLHGLMLLGAATAIVGGIGALRESTSLGWLGYLAVGQGGLATVGLTSGTPGGRQAGLIVLASMALAVTLLGMGMGMAIRATRQTHLAALAHLPRNHLARVALPLGLLVLAPLPPFTGFTALRLLLASLLDGGSGWGWVVVIPTLAGEFLLATATWRIVLELLGGPSTNAAGANETLGEDLPNARPASPASGRVAKEVPSWDVAGALAGVTTLVVVLGLIPTAWLADEIGIPLQQPSLGANILATMLALLAATSAPVVLHVALRWLPPESRSLLLARLARPGKLELALDPYVMVGGLLLTMGRVSAMTLNQTLGRLARAR